MKLSTIIIAILISVLLPSSSSAQTMCLGLNCGPDTVGATGSGGTTGHEFGRDLYRFQTEYSSVNTCPARQDCYNTCYSDFRHSVNSCIGTVGGILGTPPAEPDENSSREDRNRYAFYTACIGVANDDMVSCIGFGQTLGQCNRDFPCPDQ